MSPTETRNKVLKVLTKIQLQLGQEEGTSAPLSGATIPAKEIENFDSKVWPLAKARIGRELDVKIPDRERLFVRDKCTPVTVDDVVARICVLAAKQETRKKKAAAA